MKAPAMDQRVGNIVETPREDFQFYQQQRENRLLRKALILIVLLMMVSTAIVAFGAHVGAHGSDSWYARFIVWVANLILA